MSTQGKMIKGLIKAKKESVMGKLANEFDPMEPWSAKSDAPIKNSKGLSEEESLDESNNRILFSYIKSLGYDPKFMPFAKLSTYSRSDAFKRFKQGHIFDKNKQDIKTEEVVAEGLAQTLRKVVPGYAKREIDKKMDAGKFGKTDADKDANFQRYKKIQDKLKEQGVAESAICSNCQADPCICDDSHGFVNEAGTGHLMSFIKAKGLSPLSMDGNQKKAYSRSSEYKIFKARHQAEAIKETSGMGERADDWDDGITPAGRAAPLAKKKTVKEEADVKDVVSMDIPLLIRVLEFIREDVKTDMDLHRVVENLIELRTEGVLTMDHYDQAVKIKSIKEEINQLDELSKDTLKSYVNKIADPSRPSRGMTPKGTLKSIKAIGGVTKAIRKQYEKPLSELKKTPDNMDSDSIGVAREDSDPCWKGYQMVGMKKKGGRSVPNCVPESVEEETAPIQVKQIRSTTSDSPTHKRMHQLNKAAGLGVIKTPNSPRTGVSEGIYGIEDSPTAATHSVKAMESKKMSNAAKMVKAIHKKRMNETTYDWEKSEKGGDTDPEVKTTAKITLKGGKTMTGKPRDTVEIEPVLRTKINSPNGMKPNV